MKYKNIFNAATHGDAIEYSILKGLFEVEFSGKLSTDLISFILDICMNSSKEIRGQNFEMIDKIAYFNVVEPFAAFLANDINNDSKIDRQELKFLIYAHEKDEIPDEFRLNQEMKFLDTVCLFFL